MSRHQYTNLIEKFCKLSWLQDVSAVMAGGPIDVGGIRFSLTYNEASNPDVLIIYCECGEPPLGQDNETYRLLLKKNLFFYQGRNGPVFAISPDTGKVVLVQYELLDSMTAEALSNKLILLSAKARSWREDLSQITKESPLAVGEPRTKASVPRLLLKKK